MNAIESTPQKISAATSRLGRAVRQRRKALGQTQQEIGDLAGCGRIFVRHLEQGKPTLRVDKVLAVLDALGLELRLDTGKGLIRASDRD